MEKYKGDPESTYLGFNSILFGNNFQFEQAINNDEH